MTEFASDQEIEGLSTKMLALRGLWHKSEAIFAAMDRLDNEPSSPANDAAKANLVVKLTEVLARVNALSQGPAFTPPTPEQVKNTRDALIHLTQVTAVNEAAVAVIEGALEIHAMALGNGNLAQG